MRHLTRTRFALALLVTLALCASCGGGGSSGPSATAFVRNQFARTTDDAEPVDINGLEFQFDENTAVFAPLFQ